MKLIIEIPFESYYTFKCALEKGDTKLNALGKIIANGIPYEETKQGDLISRSALKQALHNEIGEHALSIAIDRVIDNTKQ